MNATAEETKVQANKAPVENVKMSDGRTVGFAGKRKLLKESLFENGKAGARFDFRNGETRKIFSPDSLRDRFTSHGIKQKYGDEGAGVEDVDDMVLGFDELDTQIQAGKWSEERVGGGMAGTSVLLRALVEYSGRTVEQIKEFLTGKSQNEKLALRGSTKVGPNGKSLRQIVEELEAAKVAKASKVDTDALLAEI
jgi:hypothetical protein